MLEIVTPALDRTLLMIDELRAAAGVTDGSRDIELLALGEAVAAMIAAACQVTRVGATPPTLRQEDVVETFQIETFAHHHHWRHPSLLPSEHGALWPSRKPIVAVTSIVEASNTLNPSDYQIDGAALYRVSGNYRVPWRWGPVVVSYTAGWDVVPADLKWAAWKFVQATLLEEGRDPLLKRKVIMGVSEYEWWVDPTKDSVIPAEVMDILERGGYCNRWGWMR